LVLLWWRDAHPGERAILRVFFPIDNALYSITFGTHRKKAEPIEMPFGLVIRARPRYPVLDRDPILREKRAIFRGKCSDPL